MHENVAKRFGSAFGLVQDVYLLGASMAPAESQWQSVREVVAGNLVNGYCPSDVLLEALVRMMSVAPKLA